MTGSALEQELDAVAEQVLDLFGQRPVLRQIGILVEDLLRDFARLHSRWGATLPKVLAAFTVESLSNAGVFQMTVGTEPGSMQGNYELLLTVRHFEAAYPAGNAAPTAHVALECVLTTIAPRRVLGRCDGKAEQLAANNRVSDIVAALELAAQQAVAAVGSNAAQLARNDLKK